MENVLVVLALPVLVLGSAGCVFPMPSSGAASSALYELFEWAAAVWFGGDLGVAYLGTQGDPWDAQQDMFLALLGSLAAVVMLAAAARYRRRRDAAAPVESAGR